MPTPRTSHPFPEADALAEEKPAASALRTGGYRAWVVLFFAANLGALALLALQHYWWAIAVFLLPAPWYAWQILQPSARDLGPVVTHFRTSQREVWLTIDDGPDPASTPTVLDLLDKHKARATFFLIGQKVERHPELVSEILRRGHTVGNHTHTHPHNFFWCATARRTAAEIDAGASALFAASASHTRLFRPPVGLKNHPLHPELAKRNLDLVLWSARGLDTINHDIAKVMARITAKIEPGAIILVHENPSNLALQNKLLTRLLTHLDRADYRCVIPHTETLIR